MTINSPGALPAGFVFPADLQPGLTLITGARGAGKTRWCLQLVDQARRSDLNLRGLISPAVMEGERKIGIDLLDLASGERRRLAYRIGDPDGDLRTTDWQMVAETLEWGNAILERIDTCDLFILDELGPFEFDHGIGLTAGLTFVDSHRLLPTFVVVRPSLIHTARQRWPWASVLNTAAEASA